MIFLHSSSHHSFLGDLPCVCFTSLVASTIAILICSYSSSISCFGANFTNLLCNSDLYSLSFDGFCKFILFHFSARFNFFLCITLNFCLITALTKKWSKSILGPLIDHTSSITPFLFAFIIIWSIWMPVFWSGDSHLIWRILVCWKLVLMTTMLFAYANSHNSSPFLFVSSCKVCWPVTSLYYLSFPSWEFTSPKIIIMSFFGVCPAGTLNYHKTVL